MIVADYCQQDVVIMEHSQSPLDAAIAMRECRSGDVVVVEKDSAGKTLPLGVVSDRDIAIEIVAESVDPQAVTVRDIIINPLVTVRDTTDLGECIVLMKQHAIRRLPVVEASGALIGIISVDDVIEAMSSHINDFSVLFNTPPKSPKN